MSELETDNEPKLNPEWATHMEAIVPMVIEMADTELLHEFPVGFSPIQISEDIDDRKWPELTTSEQEHILGIVFGELGFNPDDKPKPTRSYTSISSVAAAPSSQPSLTGQLKIDVFQTNRSSEGVFLHKISDLNPHSSDEWFLAGEDFEVNL